MVDVADSILDSTKKILGLAPEYDAFDLDVTTHINTVFMTLQQLGVGPIEGYAIDDAEQTWDHFLVPKTTLNAVKTYMYLRVRLLFDPPATSFALSAMQEQVNQLEWRLQVQADPPMKPIPDLLL